ncbi:hypothetical protein M0Q03_03900, partial [bacterium]|nr:hypothetical protein [bacterium]
FELPELYNKPQKYLITLKINNLSKDYTITKQEFEVPVEFMRVGKLLISFSVLSCGEIVKTWTCEPLILKSSNVLAEDWLEISPLLNDMKNVYDEKIAKLEENNLLLTNAILEIQKNINKRGEIL